MKKNRLLKVAKLIESINPALFDMDSWSSRENHCGTTFCACGYAAHVGLFKGLTLEEGRYDVRNFDLVYKGDVGEYRGWDAVEKAFNIDKYQAEYLFLGKYGDTPQSVADRIRKFVEDGGEIEEDEDA